LAAVALVVGAGAGLGAVGFRWLIFAVTWLFTGHQQFGQQGHASSPHLPFLGIFFVVAAPVIGGIIYGPLIYRYAREARGHGVPEVMLAVAENGGRIRPPVVVVKALASAITIGSGGSVGREGPIVQIGSAFASSIGQLIGTSEARLRIIVACGAAGGISATFNAPVTGLFFGFELVLREFSLDALFATSLAAVSADVVSRAFFGSAPFFSAIPHSLAITNDFTYLLVGLLALIAGLIGLGFKTVLYGLEDWTDRIWQGRPEWARPAVGGLALGLILLALPQMYGVGYPVMDRVISGHVILGLVLLFLIGKLAATSLTLAIGGSGGIFAPSLFLGAMAGTAFGVGVHDLFGPAVGPPALYAVIAMGGVFAAAAQAPLTAIASVAEMTGNFGLTLPVMLASAIAAALSKQFSYGSVYTTKLLRRGIDIERPRPAAALQTLTVGEVMTPIAVDATAAGGESWAAPRWESVGTVISTIDDPQELFEEETLEQALRQLILYGRSGLPVVSEDRTKLDGWLTKQAILRTLADQIEAANHHAERGAIASDFAVENPREEAHQPTNPLGGHQLVELVIDGGSRLIGTRVGDVSWPGGATPVTVVRDASSVEQFQDVRLRVGDQVSLLVAAPPTAVDAPTAALTEGPPVV
jgi:CIC family chloride channel protein